MSSFMSNELKVHSITPNFEIYFYNCLDKYASVDKTSHEYNEGSGYKTMESLGIEPYFIFSSHQSNFFSGANLQSYTFTNNIKDLDGSFTLTVKEDTRELKAGEKYFMDQVQHLDIIKVIENKVVVFWGVVRTISIGATAGAMNKVITISGMSAAGLLNMFNISTDMKSMSTIMANAENGKISDRISALFKQKDAQGKPISVDVNEVFRIVYLALHYIAKGHIYINGQWIESKDKKKPLASFKIQRIFRYIFGTAHDDNHRENNILTYNKEMYDKPVEFLDCDIKMDYQLVSNLFNQSEVNIVSYFKGMLPNILYEFFHEFDANNKPKIIMREVPFSPEKWKALDNNGKPFVIDPSLITDYTLTQTDTNIFTAFYAYPAGTTNQKDIYRYVEGGKKDEDPVQRVDDRLLQIYGYIPLDASFLGYKPEKLGTDNQIAVSRKLSEKLGSMYRNLKDYWSGDVTFINKMESNGVEYIERVSKTTKEEKVAYSNNIPKLGSKVQLCGLQFYVTSKTHSWRYGEPCKINLKIERGGKYDAEGNFIEPLVYDSKGDTRTLTNPSALSKTWAELLNKE